MHNISENWVQDVAAFPTESGEVCGKQHGAYVAAIWCTCALSMHCPCTVHALSMHCPCTVRALSMHCASITIQLHIACVFAGIKADTVHM